MTALLSDTEKASVSHFIFDYYYGPPRHDLKLPTPIDFSTSSSPGAIDVSCWSAVKKTTLSLFNHYEKRTIIV